LIIVNVDQSALCLGCNNVTSIYWSSVAGINIINTQEHQQKINVGLDTEKLEDYLVKVSLKLWKVHWWPLPQCNH